DAQVQSLVKLGCFAHGFVKSDRNFIDRISRLMISRIKESGFPVSKPQLNKPFDSSFSALMFSRRNFGDLGSTFALRHSSLLRLKNFCNPPRRMERDLLTSY